MEVFVDKHGVKLALGAFVHLSDIPEVSLRSMPDGEANDLRRLKDVLLSIESFDRDGRAVLVAALLESSTQPSAEQPARKARIVRVAVECGDLVVFRGDCVSALAGAIQQADSHVGAMAIRPSA